MKFEEWVTLGTKIALSQGRVEREFIETTNGFSKKGMRILKSAEHHIPALRDTEEESDALLNSIGVATVLLLESQDHSWDDETQEILRDAIQYVTYLAVGVYVSMQEEGLLDGLADIEDVLDGVIKKISAMFDEEADDEQDN